jgi:guanidinopropionase
MIHFDSHPDPHGAALGTLHHAGSPFRVGFDEGLIDPGRTVQVGFHGSMAALSADDWSKEHFTVIDMERIFERGVDWVASEIRRVVGDGPTYFSFDLDVLDLAYAPAVADPEVNGMTTRDCFPS